MSFAKQVLLDFGVASGVYGKYHEEPNVPAMRLRGWMNEIIAKVTLPSLAADPVTTDIVDKERYGKHPVVLYVLKTLAHSNYKGEELFRAETVEILLSLREAARLDASIRKIFLLLKWCDRVPTARISYCLNRSTLPFTTLSSHLATLLRKMCCTSFFWCVSRSRLTLTDLRPTPSTLPLCYRTWALNCSILVSTGEGTKINNCDSDYYKSSLQAICSPRRKRPTSLGCRYPGLFDDMPVPSPSS